MMVTLTISVTGQTKWSLSVSPGLFMDPFYTGDDIGLIVNCSGGYRMKNDAEISVSLFQAEIRKLYSKLPLFEEPGLVNQTWRGVNLSFSKNLLKSPKHSLDPSVGIIYRQWFFSPPTYAWSEETPGERVYYGFKMNGEVWHDIGFSLEIRYLISVNERLSIGVETGTWYLLFLGFESLHLSPVIKVKF